DTGDRRTAPAAAPPAAAPAARNEGILETNDTDPGSDPEEGRYLTKRGRCVVRGLFLVRLADDDTIRTLGGYCHPSPPQNLRTGRVACLARDGRRRRGWHGVRRAHRALGPRERG